MKKRTVKKLKLKKGIKTALILVGIYAMIMSYLLIATNRVNNIQNNQNGYTESGHAHSVNVQIIK